MPIGFPFGNGGGGLASWLDEPLGLWAYMNLPFMGASNAISLADSNLIAASTAGIGNDFCAFRYPNSIVGRKYDFDTGRFVWETAVNEATNGLYNNRGQRPRTRSGSFFVPFNGVGGQFPRAVKLAADGTKTIIAFPNGSTGQFPVLFYMPETDRIIARYNGAGGTWFSSSGDDGVTWTDNLSTTAMPDVVMIFEEGTNWLALNNDGLGNVQFLVSPDLGVTWTIPVNIITGGITGAYAAMRADNRTCIVVPTSGGGLWRGTLGAGPFALTPAANLANAFFPAARAYSAPRFHPPSERWVCMMNTRVPCISTDDAVSWKIGNIIQGFSPAQPFEGGTTMANQVADEFNWLSGGQLLYCSKNQASPPVINLI